MPLRKPAGVPVGMSAEIDRAARQRQRFYVSTPTPADEIAEDVRWHRAQAEYRKRRSTSSVPARCAGCGEWNAATRKRCRRCGSERAA